MTAQFLSLLHRYGYIYRPHGSSQWISANESWKLTDTEILKAISCTHPKYLLGCRSGRATRFAVLDIDAGSRYHNQQELQRITSLLVEAGLPESTLYRSSDSGGWHLYLFFDEPISSKDLRNQLTSLLRLNDFVVSKGTLEVFPQPGDGSLGQGLRLPLQPGWAWLNPETLAVREEREGLSPVEALSLFLSDLENEANTHHEFHRLKAHVQDLQSRREEIRSKVRREPASVIPITREHNDQTGDSVDEVREAFGHIPPGINPDTWAKGRHYYDQGLTGASQRADAIFCLSHYFFYGDPQRQLSPMGYGYENERTWAIQEILQAKHNGYSKDISRGRSDALEQAKRAAFWRPMRLTETGEQPKRYRAHVPKAWVLNNTNRKVDARKRIRESVDTIVASNTTLTLTAIREQSGCSWKTLYKHSDIWRPFLAASTHVYNVVVGGGGQETAALPQSQISDMPPGRLAARQIVHELIMRAEREKKQHQKEALNLRSGLFDSWQGKVQSLTTKQPSEVATRDLKPLIAVLGFYLSMAPTEDDANDLACYIQKVRDEISNRYIRPESCD